MVPLSNQNMQQITMAARYLSRIISNLSKTAQHDKFAAKSVNENNERLSNMLRDAMQINRTEAMIVLFDQQRATDVLNNTPEDTTDATQQEGRDFLTTLCAVFENEANGASNALQQFLTTDDNLGANPQVIQQKAQNLLDLVMAEVGENTQTKVKDDSDLSVASSKKKI